MDATGDRYRTASENSMNRACASLFRDLFRKCAHPRARGAGCPVRPTPSPPPLLPFRYENPSNVDALSRVQGQLNAVTETMQDNLRQMLANVDKAEVLEDDAGGC